MVLVMLICTWDGHHTHTKINVAPVSQKIHRTCCEVAAPLAVFITSELHFNSTFFLCSDMKENWLSQGIGQLRRQGQPFRDLPMYAQNAVELLYSQFNMNAISVKLIHKMAKKKLRKLKDKVNYYSFPYTISYIEVLILLWIS